MEVAGPLGTPLGLAQRKRASPRGQGQCLVLLMPLFELSRMDSPPKLTGETLIVHHIPLVLEHLAERSSS